MAAAIIIGMNGAAANDSIRPWRVLREVSDAFHDSRRSVARAARLPGLGLTLKRRLIHVLKLRNGVAILRIARGAGETLVFLKPTKTYLQKVAAAVAVQDDGCPVRVAFRHGWPILSFVGDDANVAEAGGATSAPGGGLAA